MFLAHPNVNRNQQQQKILEDNENQFLQKQIQTTKADFCKYCEWKEHK